LLHTDSEISRLRHFETPGLRLRDSRTSREGVACGCRTADTATDGNARELLKKRGFSGIVDTATEPHDRDLDHTMGALHERVVKGQVRRLKSAGAI